MKIGQHVCIFELKVKVVAVCPYVESPIIGFFPFVCGHFVEVNSSSALSSVKKRVVDNLRDLMQRISSGWSST